MFDSHCHLDAEEYDDDRQEVLARARAAGIRGIMVPGYSPEEWPRLAPLCRANPDVVCGVGLHPLYLHELDDAGQHGEPGPGGLHSITVGDVEEVDPWSCGGVGCARHGVRLTMWTRSCQR